MDVPAQVRCAALHAGLARGMGGKATTRAGGSYDVAYAIHRASCLPVYGWAI